MRANQILSGIVIVALALLVIAATDVSNQVIRYRNGTVITFDAQSSIQDEDAGWSLTATKMKRLASLPATSFTGSVTNTADGWVLNITNGVAVSKTAP